MGDERPSWWKQLRQTMLGAAVLAGAFGLFVIAYWLALEGAIQPRHHAKLAFFTACLAIWFPASIVALLWLDRQRRRRSQL